MTLVLHGKTLETTEAVIMWMMALAGAIVSAGMAELPEWTFDTDAQGWTANAYLANVSVENGKLCADAIDRDPFFSISGLEFEAKPWQYVAIRLIANQDGQGELFWTGETTGPHGGFSQEKSLRFNVEGNGQTQDIIIAPFWQTEKTIRQLRLDLYNGAHFEIDKIRIAEWGGGAAPSDSTFEWTFNGDVTPWTISPKSSDLYSPPLNLAVHDKGWISVTLQADSDGVGAILWGAEGVVGPQSAESNVRGGPEPRIYNVEMQGIPEWRDGVHAIGIRLPKGKVKLDAIAVVGEPRGPAELAVTYLGFENALSRTSTPCRILARVANIGAAKSEPTPARMVVSPDLRFVPGSTPESEVPPLEYGESASLFWTVSTPIAMEHRVYLRVGTGKTVEGKLNFTKSMFLNKADYPPRPVPVKSDVDVCAYYFPGWDSDAKWDCIRRTAPIRKPALGYYDESKPECVDWQIKWAVENGISCFLVDWYWCQGGQSLTHWFEAYRKARYRDMLKVAIMWANHNPPNTHSAEDWRAVTKEWIDRYFNLPAYYRIEGKPAVFIWAPSNVRRDLGGSDAVKQAMNESQEMARAAGYDGITFVAMGYDFSQAGIKNLENEGYTGITTYHEWGGDHDRAMALKRMPYLNVVRGSKIEWDRKNAQAKPLAYYPVVDTGWDSRPWHGDKAFVIEGRTALLFEQLLESAHAFAIENNKPLVVLGPVNEWGEGSYIEPCVEFGFDMLEAVRRVFGVGNARLWPVNVGPADIGLGPYDYPARPSVSAWTFDTPDAGWKAMMGVANVRCEDGKLLFDTTNDDPALVVETHGIKAAQFTKATFNMQLEGTLKPDARAQLFWSISSAATSEAASASFPLIADGQMHLYTVDLKACPRWRGNITALRFDPCGDRGVRVAIDDIQLMP